MIAWLAVTSLLMAWNVIYCARQTLRDLRGPTPARGVWGLFALAGALSTLLLIVTAVLVAGAGI